MHPTQRSSGTASALSTYINMTGTISVNKMRVNVRILDARMNFGNPQIQIEPISGEGTSWVYVSSVNLD